MVEGTFASEAAAESREEGHASDVSHGLCDKDDGKLADKCPEEHRSG